MARGADAWRAKSWRSLFRPSRLAQAFGPRCAPAPPTASTAPRLRQSPLSLCADELAAYGTFSAIGSSRLSASHALRAELRLGGVRSMSSRPARDRVASDRAAAQGRASGARPRDRRCAAVRASRTCMSATWRRGSYARGLRVNPKALERECRLNAAAAQPREMRDARQLEPVRRRHRRAAPSTSSISPKRSRRTSPPSRCRLSSANVRRFGSRKSHATTSAGPAWYWNNFSIRRAHRHAFRCADPLGVGQGSRPTTPSTPSPPANSSRLPR